MPEIQPYRCTFGVGWGPLGKRYVRIDEARREVARDKMTAMFGTRWAFMYSQEEWDKSRERGYNTGLTQLVIGDEGVDDSV
jgi:hypothetical protein